MIANSIVDDWNLGAQVKYQVVGSLPSNMMSPSPSGKRSKEVRKP